MPTQEKREKEAEKLTKTEERRKKEEEKEQKAAEREAKKMAKEEKAALPKKPMTAFFIFTGDRCSHSLTRPHYDKLVVIGGCVSLTQRVGRAGGLL